MDSLFMAEVPVSTLKAMMAAAAPFCKTLNLVLGEDGIQFHGTDDGRNASVVGRVRGELEVMGTGIQVGVDVKALTQRLSPLDPKGIVGLEIERDGRRHILRMRHADTERELTIEESEVQAIVPEVEQTGTASIDPVTFTKVISSLKDHSDVVMLEIQRGALAVGYKTSKSRESWKYPCSTGGKGSAMFSTTLLQAVTKGTAKLGKVASLHIGKDMPLRVRVEGEALEADFYLGDRSVMS